MEKFQICESDIIEKGHIKNIINIQKFIKIKMLYEVKIQNKIIFNKNIIQKT